MDTFAGRFIPNPALLAKRLQMTGKNWSVGKYGMISLGLFFYVRKEASRSANGKLSLDGESQPPDG